MDIPGLEAFVRLHFDPLQYAAFFGVLFVLGAIEVFAAGNGTASRRRWPANAGLTVLNILVLAALPVGVVAAADFTATRGWGLLNQDFVPPLAALALGILLRSLIGYVIHIAMHKVPLLWRVHRVHHTDTAMDVSTTVRFHPLEFVISLPIVLAATVALGLPPLALLLYELADAAMAAFTHANLRLPARLERALQWVLVTPVMHRIHHSALQPETDSNYGAMFSWWDRLFGTYRTRPPETLAAIPLGLDDGSAARANGLGWLLVSPFLRQPAQGPAPQPLPAAGGRA